MTDIIFETYTGAETATINGYFSLDGQISEQHGAGGVDIAGSLSLDGDIVAKTFATIHGLISLFGNLPQKHGAGGIDIAGAIALNGHTFRTPLLPTVTAMNGGFGLIGHLQTQYIATINGEISLIGKLAQKHGAGGVDIAGFTEPQGFLLRELNYVGGFGVFQSPGYVYMRDLNDAHHKFLLDRVDFHASSPSAQAVLQLLDSIAFGGSLSQTTNLHAAIAASLAFGSSILGGAGGILADTVNFGDEAVALAVLVATLLDSFAVSAELMGSAAIFAFLSDAFEFNDIVDVKQQILQALSDGIEFGMTLYTGADTYTAWVMTPKTRAMRSYSNYAFNSYAQFGGRLYGAKEDGVYLLEGDTDAGQEIHASARSGLLDFGSRQFKRVERAYLGYTAEGTLALRVTTTSPQGTKVDYTYRMVTPPQADAPREARVIIGKGLQSVYWAFEIDNSLDGGNFELHDVTVLPVILSRKVR